MKFTSLASFIAMGAAVATLAQDVPPAQNAGDNGPAPAGQRGPGGPGGMRGQRGQRGPGGNGGQRGPGGNGGQRGPGGMRGGANGGFGGMMGGMMGAMASDMETQMFTRMITRPQFAQQIGLSEDTINELNDSFTDIDVRLLDLQTKLEEATKVQSDLLKATPLDEEAVMKAVDNVWEIRKQIAALQTQKLIVVLKTLTPEQTAKARELMQNRRGFGGFGGGNRGPNGGNGPQPRPAPAPLPAPEAAPAPAPAN